MANRASHAFFERFGADSDTSATLGSADGSVTDISALPGDTPGVVQLAAAPPATQQTAEQRRRRPTPGVHTRVAEQSPQLVMVVALDDRRPGSLTDNFAAVRTQPGNARAGQHG